MGITRRESRGVNMVIWLWVGFIALILVFLALDLGVFNRKAHVVNTREALLWTALWIAVALCFNVGVYFLYEHHLFGRGLDPDYPLSGSKAAVQFLTGWLTEYSLSMDNIFIIAMIFTFFRVPAAVQHRVLFWGILGALVMRGAMIGLGSQLIDRFHFTIYVFGALLLYSAVKMLRAGDEAPEPDKNVLVRMARKVFPVTPDYIGNRFFSRLDGRRAMTPLFVVLLVVESTDVLFAVDSIPAIFGITKDSFLVFTSNVFAILGLRSLFFALAGLMDKFRYLKFSLVFILAFIGVKMLMSWKFTIDEWVSLSVIVVALAVGVAASLLKKPTTGEPLDL